MENNSMTLPIVHDSNDGQEKRPPEGAISHPVKKHVREAVGIREEEPATLVVHVTQEKLAYDITDEGFVNVSGRGTLASILDNPSPDKKTGVPSIVQGKVSEHPKNTTIITFCVPTKYLRQDPEKYGLWFDNRLHPGQHPNLWNVYKKIAIKYDDQTGEPTKYARDDSSLYPVYIPKKYILGIATTSK
jgi:hypothetical protein